MSQKNREKLTCSNCGNVFEAILYRTIWGEYQENRDLVMNDLINVVECPSCHIKTKVEYALFFNDPEVFCGIWWEPHHEPEIDHCTALWSQMWGKNNYMAQATRIKDWQEFKETILIYESMRLALSSSENTKLASKLVESRVKSNAKSEWEELIFVQGGTFMMGSSEGNQNERPVHRVVLSSFHIGKYPVTQIEWNKVMSSNTSLYRGDNLPVGRISFYDAIEYCIKRSIYEGLTPCYKGKRLVLCNWDANGYRLPTEAEWEYAARGGCLSKGYKYSGSNDINEVAWYGKSPGVVHPVGKKKPNELGIYDMSGNIWEWCWDWYTGYYYKFSPTTNPKGFIWGKLRVDRGGCFGNESEICQVTKRQGFYPTSDPPAHGFRVVRRD